MGKTFDEWAGEFIEFRRASKHKPTAQSTLDKFEWSRQAVRRQFGGLPITDVSVPQIIDALRAIERTGKLHKSTKAKTFISQVFRFAAGSGVQVMNPGRIVSDAVMRPATRNHAAITDPQALRGAVEGHRRIFGGPEHAFGPKAGSARLPTGWGGQGPEMVLGGCGKCDH